MPSLFIKRKTGHENASRIQRMIISGGNFFETEKFVYLTSNSDVIRSITANEAAFYKRNVKIITNKNLAVCSDLRKEENKLARSMKKPHMKDGFLYIIKLGLD